jgi:phage terminase large subunit GpA-like protein
MPELLPVHEWAAKHRLLSSEVTAKPGLYDVSITPWMQEPQESFDDPSVMITVLCLASRLGKTEGFLNLIGRTIDSDPKNILQGYPTLDSAKKWAKEFLVPMFESNPRIFGSLISDPSKRDGENTMLSKRYPGGRISGIGANSPSAFRQIQAPIVLLDEIDAMGNSREGDPVTLAFKRADNYDDSIQAIASTPTIKGESKIWEWLEKSDWRQWFVPSPHTGKHHVLDMSNLRWTKNQPEKAVYVDPDSGDEWTEEHRQDSVMAGEWRGTQSFKGIRGYQANGMISLFAPKKGYKSKYHQMAADFLDAKHAGTEELKVWTNTFLAKVWEDPALEKVDWQRVQDLCEEWEPDILPDSVLCLTFAADVQADRIEFEWVGWRDGFESYGIRYAVIAGDTKRKDVWDKLALEVRREWPHEAGGSLRVERGFVDEGHNAEQVRLFCLDQLRSGIQIFPSKGIGRSGVSEPELVDFKAQKRQKGIKAPTWNIGVNRAKRVIYSHLLLPAPGSNTMHWNGAEGAGYTDSYFEMLTSETCKRKFQSGREYTVFEKPSGARNEALDIRGYNYAAAVSLNPSWDGLRKRVTQMSSRERVHVSKPATEEPQPKPQPVKKKWVRKVRSGGWMKGY